MNITPTKLKTANSMATKIACYDTTQKKAVLLFKSITQCVAYLFEHRIFSTKDNIRFMNLVNLKCCRKKEKEDQNVFAKVLTYRYANDEQKRILDNMDYIILDNDFINVDYEAKMKRNNPRYNEYGLEEQLKVGDFVEILFGKLKGYSNYILEIKEKSNTTPGRFNYTINVNGEKKDFKSNVLKLIESA